MTANDILTALTSGDPCPSWICRAALVVDPPTVFAGQVAHFYETTAVNFFPETTVRIPEDGVTRRGKPRFQRRRLDLVALVQPHYKCFEPFAIGVEIKVTRSDLMGDEKLIAYSPYVHLFYLAVPVALKDDAIYKLAIHQQVTAGLLLVDGRSIIIERQAQLLPPTDTHLKELYAELLLRPFKLAKKERKLFIQFV
jgi:hypothetical protein